MTSTTITFPAKGVRLVGADRDRVGADLAKKYKDGASIRDLAIQAGRSYGFVHRILKENDVAFRTRGGANRRRKAS